MKSNRKSIIITGATGFIGRHCLNSLLEQDYEIYAICHKKRELQDSQRVHWIVCDLLDGFQVEQVFRQFKPEYLLHLAWDVDPKTYQNSGENICWLYGSIHLVQIAIQFGCKKIVTAGTCFEYQFDCSVLNEKHCLSRDNLYSVSKSSLFHICTLLCRKSGVSYSHGRIFYLFGPGEKPERIIPYVIHRLMKGLPAEVSSGEQIRDFLFVQDVADAFSAILACDYEGAVNIGSGKGIRLRDIFYMIGAAIGADSELIRLGAVEMKWNEPSQIVADNTILRKEAKWSQKISLEEGLQRTVDWWKLCL